MVAFFIAFMIASFQFTPNSFCIMVAFFIAFMEAGISKPNVDKFAYVYGIKALAKHEGFSLLPIGVPI